ncbi:outer membrane protein [Deinobacterium chartae]|uniref:Outer membrane protein n=1 Tax=Deinobacterium chartae TaxID=521158 RepID=A0A841HWS3_9DEIO|nr:OmpH family outer membrane protein [Deinobacterium chartae]MBB6097313.1 outer membrane protein [Deinobacterium chartae]
MKASQLLPIAVFGALAFGLTAPHAQTPAQKVGFVNVQELLNAHPQNASIQELSKKARAELDPLNKQFRDLDAKVRAGSASAAEKQNYETIGKTLQATSEKYQKELDGKLNPVTDQINKLVAETAKKQGFTIVMDRGVAASSGLVVYADEASTDFTAEVVKALKP